MEKYEKNGMIMIQMTEKEAEEVGSTMIEMLKALYFAAGLITDLFDIILPVVVEIKKEKKTTPEKSEKNTCENCTLPCLANPIFQRHPDATEEESEANVEERRRLLQKYKEELLEWLENQ